MSSSSSSSSSSSVSVGSLTTSLESLSVVPPERIAAAEAFKKTSVLIASLFAVRSEKMSSEGRGTFMTAFIPLAKQKVLEKTGDELVARYIEKLEELRKLKPDTAPAAYKSRNIAFILENEDIFVTVEMARGIIKQCLDATDLEGKKYFDNATITIIWTHIRNLMVNASNYIKFTPETYPDPNIIKSVWL